MKLKSLFTFFLFCICTSAVFAQAHNTSCSNCAYYIAKPSSNPDAANARNECGCQACTLKKKKEKEAKALEQKRKDDANTARIKAEQAAKKLVYEEKKRKEREEATKTKSGEVLINVQPEEESASTPTDDIAKWEKLVKKRSAENIDKMSRSEVITRMDEVAKLAKSYTMFGGTEIQLTQAFSENGFYNKNDPEGDRYGSDSRTFSFIPWNKLKQTRSGPMGNIISVVTLDFTEKMEVGLEEISVMKNVTRRTIKEDYIPVFMPAIFKDIFIKYVQRMQALAQ